MTVDVDLTDYHWKNISSEGIASSKFNSLSLGKDLLMKFLNKDYTKRIEINEALQHPWITRDFAAPIPLTYYDEVHWQSNRRDLIALIRACLFFANLPTVTVFLDSPASGKEDYQA